MEEIWRDIEGYEGKYKVSNTGQVWSKRSNKTLIPVTETRGYLRVTLCKNGKCRAFRIHRLVAVAFINNPENKKQVNHIDECKTNNSTTNLEWCTNKENNSYGTKSERWRQTISTSDKWKQGRIIRDEKCVKPVIGVNISDGSVLYFKSLKQTDEYGFNKTCVSKCIRRVQVSHRGYKWYKQ